MATWLDNDVYAKFRGSEDLAALSDTFHSAIDALEPDPGLAAHLGGGPAEAAADGALPSPEPPSPPPQVAPQPEPPADAASTSTLPAPDAPVTAPLQAPAPTGGAVVAANQGGREGFKQSFAPYADYAARILGIDPSIVTSMAISESGGGNIPGNSFFGMKGSPYASGSINLPTWELVNGQRVNINDNFATFASPKDAIDAWIDFLQKHTPGVFGAKTPEAFAAGLKAGGYMTDTAAHYAATLRNLGAQPGGGEPSGAIPSLPASPQAAPAETGVQTPTATSASSGGLASGLQSLSDAFHQKIDDLGAVAGQVKDTGASAIQQLATDFHQKINDLGSAAPAANEAVRQGILKYGPVAQTQNVIKALGSMGLLAGAENPNVSDQELANHAIMALSFGSEGGAKFDKYGVEQGFVPPAAKDITPPEPAAPAPVSKPIGDVWNTPAAMEPLPPRAAPPEPTPAVSSPTEAAPVTAPITPPAPAPRELPPPETFDVNGTQLTGKVPMDTTISQGATQTFGDLKPPAPPPDFGKVAWGALAEGKKSIFSLTNFHPLTITEGTALGPAGLGAGFRVARTYIGGVVRGSTIDALRSGELAPWFQRAQSDGVRLLGMATNNPDTGGAAAGTLPPLGLTAARAAGGAITGFAGAYGSSEAAGASDQDKLRNGLLGGAAGAILGPTLAVRMHNALWQQAVPLAKVLTYKAAVEGGVAGPEAAMFTNNLAGGQNLAQIAGSDAMETAARLIIQSPDWLLSQLKLAGAGLKGTAKSLPGVEKLPKMGPMTGNEKLSRDWLLKTLGVGTAVTELLNLAFTGHLTNENEPGHLFQVEIPTGTSNRRGDINTTLSLFPGNLQGLLNLVSSGGDVGRFVENRLSPAVTIPFGLMANQQYPGGPPITKESDTGVQERAKQAGWMAGRFAPIGITSAAQQSLYHAPLPLIAASALTGLTVGHDTAQAPRGAASPAGRRSVRAPLGRRPTPRR